jgi:hypothetical protein
MGILPNRTNTTIKTAEPNDRVTSTPASTAVRMPNYGKTLLNGASTLAVTYIMENPMPGVRKVIKFSSGSTLVARTITGPTTTVLFSSGATSGANLAFQTAGAFVELEGQTSLVWDVLINSSATLS